MIVRHILPGAGLLPADLARDSMSGLVGVAYNLARQQSMRGWKAELFGLARPGAPARSLVSLEGVHMIPLRPWRWCHFLDYDFRYFAPLAVMLVRKGSADIHHVYTNPYLLRFGRANMRILHIQMSIPEVTQAYVRAVQLADAVICCSKFIREQFLQRVQYAQEQVHVIYNGVDLGRFTPGDKDAARAALDLPTDETIILYTGAVNEDKGLIHLVRALNILTHRHQLRLVVAGSASLWGNVDSYKSFAPGTRTRYEEMLIQEAHSLKATFLGLVAQAKMPLVFQAADIAVCPSVCEEAFSLANLEAMATGLPVVGSNVGGIPEAVLDSVTGFLVPPGNAVALADRLEVLLCQPELRAEMGRNALRFVRRFDWGCVGKQIEMVYLRSLRRKGTNDSWKC